MDGPDKVEVHRGLGVGEVWIWQKGSIRVFVLSAGTYDEVPSRLLRPEVDLAAMCRCLEEAETRTGAVKAFVAAPRQVSQCGCLSPSG